jgi:hypothetical protein
MTHVSRAPEGCHCSAASMDKRAAKIKYTVEARVGPHCGIEIATDHHRQ